MKVGLAPISEDVAEARPGDSTLRAMAGILAARGSLRVFRSLAERPGTESGQRCRGVEVVEVTVSRAEERASWAAGERP